MATGKGSFGERVARAASIAPGSGCHPACRAMTAGRLTWPAMGHRSVTAPTRRLLAALAGSLALLVLPAGASAAAAPSATLELIVDGLASRTGNVAYSLYASLASYRTLDPEKALRKGSKPAAGETVRWRLADLPPGDYALTVYHDENGNGELDRGAFGQPTEPYGFSNDARGRFGPPPWGAVRFTVVAPCTELRVTVR